jgi:hypothetical protein
MRREATYTVGYAAIELLWQLAAGSAAAALERECQAIFSEDFTQFERNADTVNGNGVVMLRLAAD